MRPDPKKTKPHRHDARNEIEAVIHALAEVADVMEEFSMEKYMEARMERLRLEYELGRGRFPARATLQRELP